MANIGDKLTSPESGWQRIDDSNVNIKYNGTWNTTTVTGYYNSTLHYSQTNNVSYVFYFYGTKVRIIANDTDGYVEDIDVIIDNSINDSYSLINKFPHTSNISNYSNILLCEKQGLTKTIHKVEVKCTNMNNAYSLSLDAIDIDDDGYMCTEIQYEIQEAQNRKFPVMIGDSTITSEENIANYANTLTSGERQVLIMESGDMFLTDGQGGYKKINSGDGSLSGSVKSLPTFEKPTT